MRGGRELREYAVENILEYQKLQDGQEWFHVKWVGSPVGEATWEPRSHFNDNCKELMAKVQAGGGAAAPPAKRPKLQAPSVTPGSSDAPGTSSRDSAKATSAQASGKFWRSG